MTDTARAAPDHRSDRPKAGLLMWLARRTNRLALPLAGRRWFGFFAVVEHRGRRTGALHRTPVAARRVDGGFVVSLAFGPTANWYQNLLGGDGGAIIWKGRRYPVTRPVSIERADGIAPFLAVQKLLLRVTGIDGYIRVDDATVAG